MSEACVLSTYPYTPSSPDPTHLRLLAFSVAEAALQSDPNSPSFSLTTDRAPVLPEFSRRLCNWPIKVENVEEDWKKNRWRGTEYETRAQWKMGHKKMGMKKCESCEPFCQCFERQMADGSDLSCSWKDSVRKPHYLPFILQLVSPSQLVSGSDHI